MDAGKSQAWCCITSRPIAFPSLGAAVISSFSAFPEARKGLGKGLAFHVAVIAAGWGSPVVPPRHSSLTKPTPAPQSLIWDAVLFPPTSCPDRPPGPFSFLWTGDRSVGICHRERLVSPVQFSLRDKGWDPQAA